MLAFAAVSLLALLAAALPVQTPPPADAVRGGQLYDNWYNTLGVTPPESDHPLWSQQQTNPRTGAATWRCQTCHGWDYQGRDGAYSQTTFEYTGFPGVLGVVGMPNQEILNWLNGTANPSHNFSAYLSPEAMLDLVAFLRTKQVNIALLVDYPTQRALGTSESGQPLYAVTCERCHGDDGSQLNFGSASQPVFIGDIGRLDPWRMIHKIRFGHPGSDMPASEALGWPLQDVADLLAYTQTLPLGQPPPTPQPGGVAVVTVDYSEQGDTTPIVIAAGAILLVILGATGWFALRKR